MREWDGIERKRNNGKGRKKKMRNNNEGGRDSGMEIRRR